MSLPKLVDEKLLVNPLNQSVVKSFTQEPSTKNTHKYTLNIFIILILMCGGIFMWFRFEPIEQTNTTLPLAVRKNEYHKKLGKKKRLRNFIIPTFSIPAPSNKDSINVKYTSF